MARKQNQPSTGEQQRDYFRVREAAKYLCCAPWCISAAIREKRLPYLQLGKRYVLLKDDLDRFAEQSRTAV